eukprot:PhM_4_TR6260/c0_g1_i1/m.83093
MRPATTSSSANLKHQQQQQLKEKQQEGDENENKTGDDEPTFSSSGGSDDGETNSNNINTTSLLSSKNTVIEEDLVVQAPMPTHVPPPSSQNTTPTNRPTTAAANKNNNNNNNNNKAQLEQQQQKDVTQPPRRSTNHRATTTTAPSLPFVYFYRQRGGEAVASQASFVVSVTVRSSVSLLLPPNAPPLPDVSPNSLAGVTAAAPPGILCITRSCGSIDYVGLTPETASHLVALNGDENDDRSPNNNNNNNNNGRAIDDIDRRHNQEDLAFLQCMLSVTQSQSEALTENRLMRRELRIPRTAQGPRAVSAELTRQRHERQISESPGRPLTSMGLLMPPAGGGGHVTPDLLGDASPAATQIQSNTTHRYVAYPAGGPCAHKTTSSLDNVTQGLLVNRLYDTAVHRREQRTAERLDRIDRLEKHRRVLTAEEQEDLGDRLYYRQKQHSLQTSQRLRQRYMDETPIGRLGGKAKARLTRSEADAVGTRLCNDTMEHQKKVREQLFKAYVDSTEVKKVKISKERLEAMATRLSTYTK